MKFCTLAIALLMVVLVLCGSIFEKDLSKIILNQLDEKIHGTISYSDYSLSLFKSFPHVRATFSDIEVYQDEDKVIDADDFSIEVDVLQLLNKNVQVNGIEIQSGDVHIIRNKNGKTNLELIFASEESDSETQPINIEHVSLKDVHVRYQDLKSKDEYRLHIDDGELSAHIKEEIINIYANGTGKIDFISIANLSYAEQQAFDIKGKINIFRAQSLYQFNDIDLAVGKNKGILSGSMKSLQGGIKYDIEISEVNSTISSLIKSLPREYAKYLDDYALHGKTKGTIRVHGVKDDKTNPHVSITSTVSNGSIHNRNKDVELKGIHGSLTYNNGDPASLKSSILHVSDLMTSWDGQDLRGNFIIKDFLQPKADGSLNGELKLKSFQTYFDRFDMAQMDGSIFIHQVDFEDLALSNRVSQIDGINDIALNCSVSDVHFKCGGQAIYFSKGDIVLQDNQLNVTNADGLIGESDVHFVATIDDFVAGILLQQNKVASITADLKSKNINAKELWTWYKALNRKEAIAVPVSTSIVKPKQWFNKIQSAIQFSVQSLDFEKIHGANYTGSVQQNKTNYIITATGESFSGGMSIESKGKFYPRIDAETTISTDKSDITSLFSQFENFDQNFIRSEHLSGNMNVKSHIKCDWDKNGNINKEDLELDAYFDIRNGELKDLEMLKQFSKYVDLDELSNIKFSKLSNLIEVRNGEVFIPAMFIQNSACNMMISGMHSLDNQIHYNMKVNAGQSIGLKLIKNKEKNKIIPARKDGWFNMYFNVNGTVEDFEYEYNKSLVQRGFQFGEKKKLQILSRLTDIFGPMEQFEEPLDWLDIPEYIDDETEFIDTGEEYINNF